MKILVITGMLAILFASSPALAKKSGRVSADARSAYSQATHPYQRENMNGPDGQIFWHGSAKGKDPDPFIRGSMVRGYGNNGGL
ncbi:MAG TPA: hypothetical protein VJL90_13440 [Pseudorhodoplanes sp.]|nr:hypothetical protein [Pseudorhodoplanes sp.]